MSSLIFETKAFSKFWIRREATNKKDVSFLSAVIQMFLLQLALAILVLGTFEILAVELPEMQMPISGFGTPGSVSVPMLVLILAITASLEEIIFRGVPILFAHLIHLVVEGNFFFWLMGIVSSLAFGLLHLANFGGFEASYLVIVINQTLAGFIFYWMAKTWGLEFSIMYHLAFNMILLSVVTIFS